MPRFLIFARHGETVDNARGVTQGWGYSALSDLGKGQVKALGRRMAGVDLNSIYASPLPRAVTTAEAVSGQSGHEVKQLEDLREMNCGRWEGVPFLKIRDEEKEIYRTWVGDPAFPCPDGESLVDVQARLERAIATILDENSDPESTVLVVSHGTAIRIAATTLLDLPIAAARGFMQDNTAINVFERRGRRFLLRSWNDTSHLNGDS
jgi:broad specificity phosphatase PhoE